LKTFTPTNEEIERKWYWIDADGQVLGRAASRIAQILRRKHKPIWTPHLDVGDFVIVVNADKIRVTGRKAEQKRYYRHSGYPGGLKVTPYKRIKAKQPEFILREAVKGMLPHNRLGRKMLKKLKIYPSPEHPHQAQKPKPLSM
jgi:large subunit ribosomal protein L13